MRSLGLGLALGGGVLGGLELALRLTGFADAEVYVPPRLVQVVQSGQVSGEFTVRAGRHFVEEPLPDGRPGIRTAPEYRLGQGQGYPFSGSMRDLHFSPEPAPGVERYFLLGGSAALGQNPVGPMRPWSQRALEPLTGGVMALAEYQSISGQLRDALAAQGRKVEILNAGMIAQDSGGVRNIASELLAFKPTALLLYLGNNEGIGLSAAMRDEQLPTIQAVRGALRHLRIYRGLVELLARPQGPSTSPTVPLHTLDRGARENVVLANIVSAQWSSAGAPLWEGEVPTDSVYIALQERYRANVSRIVESAREVGAQVYLLPTAPHLMYPPFSPGHDPGLSPDRVPAFERAIGQAQEALTAQRWPELGAAAEEALKLDPWHALAPWYKGVALARQGDVEQGLRWLERALLLDLSRKRTLPAYGPLAAGLCAQLGCVAADTHAALRTRVKAEGVDVYARLYGDHEHLEPEGNAWVAEQFKGLILSSRAGAPAHLGQDN